MRAIIRLVEPPQSKPEESSRRRRFLRETLTGSVPLVFGWLAGRARDLARAFEPASPAKKTSPPPEAKSDLPPTAKQAVDQHYDEFASDNPDPLKP